MSNIEEKPLHEVILDIMYFRNKEKPFPYSPEDIFWQMKDPNISERQIKEVLEWLVVKKRVEKRFGKYQIDKYEFIDISNKYKNEQEELANDKDIKPQPTKIEVVKRVSVAKETPNKKQKNNRNKNRSVFRIIDVVFIVLFLATFGCISYMLYSTPKYIVPAEDFTEIQILDSPSNLYVSTDKLSQESNEIKSKIQDISYSFVKQNKINSNVTDNINKIGDEIKTLKKELYRLNKSYETEKQQVKLIFISFLFLFLLFFIYFIISIYRRNK